MTVQVISPFGVQAGHATRSATRVTCALEPSAAMRQTSCPDEPPATAASHLPSSDATICRSSLTRRRIGVVSPDAVAVISVRVPKSGCIGARDEASHHRVAAAVSSKIQAPRLSGATWRICPPASASVMRAPPPIGTS